MMWKDLTGAIIPFMSVLVRDSCSSPAKRIGVNLSFTRAAAYFSLLNARQNQGIFVFHRPFPLLAFLEVDRLG